MPFAPTLVPATRMRLDTSSPAEKAAALDGECREALTELYAQFAQS